MLKLKLVSFGVEQVAGIYRVDGKEGRMPPRCRFLHPEAALAFQAIGGLVVVSDMFRTPESSLEAVRAKRGAQPPGYSAHNYGLAIDLDISATRARWQLQGKRSLDEAMESMGWFCHRRDHKMDHEAWHYTHLGIGAVISPKVKTIVGYTEARIVHFYGDKLAPDDLQSQGLLQKLRFYGGKLDGDIGPQSQEATRAFQRAWGIRESGKLDAKTRRTLAYVACEREMVPIPAPVRRAA